MQSMLDAEKQQAQVQVCSSRAWAQVVWACVACTCKRTHTHTHTHSVRDTPSEDQEKQERCCPIVTGAP